MRVRRYPRLLLVFSICLGIFLAYSWSLSGPQRPVAFAHAFVIGSDPVDGSTVRTAPTAVRIYFDATISSASIAHVYGPDGLVVDAARSTIPRSNPRELDTPLTPPNLLPQGSYLVRWTALANDDGHTTSGVIGFNIGRSSSGLPGQVILGPSTSNTPSELNLIGLLAVAWEWLVRMALTFWVGILVTEGLILPGVERTQNLLARTMKQTRPLQWLCLTALLIGEAITLILRSARLTQALSAGGIDLVAFGQIVVGTNYGHLWLVRVALTAFALGLLWWTTRQANTTGTARTGRQSRSRFSLLRQQVTQEQSSTKEQPVPEEEPAALSAPSQHTTIVWFVVAGLILLTLALSGDAAALAQPHISAVVLDWLYLSAQCIWLGGLTYLGYVLLPLLRVIEPDSHAETLLLLLRRFTPLIMTTLGILLVSGLFLTEVSLSSPQQLINDPYGRALLVKYLLIAVMLIFTFYALFILRPKLTRQMVLLPVVDAEMPARRARQTALEQTERNLKRALSIQSWLGAGVLLCAALMAFYAPPIVFPAATYPAVTSSATPVTNTPNIQTKTVDNLSISLQVLPARVDYANTVIVTLTDRNGTPVTDAQVKISINMEVMNMGTASKTATGNNSTYIATFDKDTTFSMFGTWDVTLTIQRPNQPPVKTVFQVTLQG